MITLDDLKAEVSIIGDSDDTLLQRKLDSAIAWVSGHLGTDADLDQPAIGEAVLRLAAHRYEFGDGLPDGLIAALAPFREWSF